MIDSTENRATRRSAARRVRTTALAGAAAAAMTLGLASGGVPEAKAADLTWDPAYTAGAYAGLVNALGNAFPGTSIAGGLYNSGPPQSATISVNNVPFIGTLNLKLLLKYISDSSVNNLYNTIGGIPLPTCGGSYASNCRYVFELGTAEGTQNLVEAYRTQIQSVSNGATPAGFIPFEANPSSTSQRPTQTNQVLAFLQNPYRPNGGFYSRFPGWADAFGINSAMPAAGRYKSADQRVVLNTTTIDATWAYDPNADLPEVPNLLAFSNSLWAALPLNLVTGATPSIVLADGAGNPVTTTQVGLNVGAVLQLSLLGITLPMTDGVPYFATIVSDQLPILTPVRLPGFAINAALKALKSPYLLGNPFADAIEPALKILINTAYPDVLAPDQLSQCATGCQPGGTPKTWAQLGYTAYQRTFLKSQQDIAFNTVDTLTPEEKKAVPGDAWNAFVDGVKAQTAKPFWGIIVPNPDNPPAPTAATPAATVKAAAAVSAPVASPVVAAQVSAPASVPAVAPAAPAEDLADLAPLADIPSVEAPASAPAPAVTGGHRGAASSSDNPDKSEASSTARHRGAA